MILTINNIIGYDIVDIIEIPNPIMLAPNARTNNQILLSDEAKNLSIFTNKL